jgi:hypothetical protein
LIDIINQLFYASGLPTDFSTDDAVLYPVNDKLEQRRSSELYNLVAVLPKGKAIPNRSLVSANFDFAQCHLICTVGEIAENGSFRPDSIDINSTISSLSFLPDSASLMCSSGIEAEQAA